MRFACCIQEFHVWKHAVDGDVLIRTTQYSLPEHLHSHIDLVQPTTYFGRSKPMSTTFHSLNISVILPGLLGLNVSVGSNPSGNSSSGNSSSGNPPVLTDPYIGVNCSEIITVSCLLQLYNANSYVPTATGKNSIGITGYLGQFANMVDLQNFFSLERPASVNPTFNTVLVNGMCLTRAYVLLLVFMAVMRFSGGQNTQDITLAGPEADLDTQFALGLTYPTPGTFYSTGGSPPFTPDDTTPTNSNEPYDNVRDNSLLPKFTMC